MKTLYIIRHAKSSWSFDLNDHDRPLGARGRRDVTQMANYLSKHVQTPSLMITSTASRALYTALFIADEWGYPEDKIILSNELFHSSPRAILQVISGYREDSIAIFGHNPGLTSLINDLQQEYVDNLPTCGVASISFPISSWSELSKSKGTLEFLISPKKIN